MDDEEDFPAKFDAFAGKPTRYAAFGAEDRERLNGRLPEALLRLFERDGFASYRKGAIWTCDPDRMLEIKQIWLERFPSAEIFMRTAFGDFFFWDQRYVWTCTVNNSQILYSSLNVTWFLSSILPNSGFFRSLGLPKFSNLGAKRCGPLEPDEAYIWVPAFALGGSSETSSIEKGKMAVASDLLRQMQEPFIDQRVELES